jgi:hypothetical protein
VLKNSGKRYVKQGKNDNQTINKFKKKYNVNFEYGKYVDPEGRTIEGWKIINKTKKK